MTFNTDLRDQPQIAVLAGAETPFRNDTDREMPFRQVLHEYYMLKRWTDMRPRRNQISTTSLAALCHPRSSC